MENRTSRSVLLVTACLIILHIVPAQAMGRGGVRIKAQEPQATSGENPPRADVAASSDSLTKHQVEDLRKEVAELRSQLALFMERMPAKRD